MAEAVQMAFDPKGMMVPMGQILPVRTVRARECKGQQYLRLFASVREIGLIEPLIISHRRTPRAAARGSRCSTGTSDSTS